MFLLKKHFLTSVDVLQVHFAVKLDVSNNMLVHKKSTGCVVCGRQYETIFFLSLCCSIASIASIASLIG